MLTYNVKISFENDSDRLHWINLLDKLRDVYNDMSVMIFYNNHVPLSLKEIHNLCYYPIRNAHPDVPSQSVIRIEKLLISNYRSNKRKFKCEKKSCSLQLDKRLYSNLTAKGINVTSSIPNKRCTASFETYEKFDELASKYVMKDPTVFCRNGELYISVTFDVPNKPVLDDTLLGIDLGIKRFYTTSDGNSVRSKDLNKLKRIIRYNKRQLQSKVKTTKSHSARKKLKNLKNREANLSKQACHLMANRILQTDKSIIVMEDLTKIKKTTSRTKEGFKRKKHNNMFSQVPFYMFKQILSYKALLKGKRVETVSPVYTSQIDCTTGKRDGVRKGCRYYSINGYVLDADWNASVNIANRKHPVSFTVPLDGRLNLTGRVLSTTQSSL